MSQRKRVTLEKSKSKQFCIVTFSFSFFLPWLSSCNPLDSSHNPLWDSWPPGEELLYWVNDHLMWFLCEYMDLSQVLSDYVIVCSLVKVPLVTHENFSHCSSKDSDLLLPGWSTVTYYNIYYLVMMRDCHLCIPIHHPVNGLVTCFSKYQ